MKTNKHKLQVGLLGLLCLALPATAVLAADQNDQSTQKKIDGSAYQTGSDQDQAGGYKSAAAANASSPSTTGTPEAFNKASGLVGMEVKNGSDERLGKIKDLVIDLQSGKVSYVVLESGSILQSKMFAVPLNAFTVSADQKSLILNTDKTRVQAATGFARDAWPSVSNPDWGASTFWEQPGASPATTSMPQTPAQTQPQGQNNMQNP